MAAVAVAIIGAAALLALAHWLAIGWQPLAEREALARPLRLDRPDSFGAWLRSALLVLASLSSLLIYQLRRYRNDDYRGNYRIWPPLIVLIGISSVDAVVGLVPWLGEWIDLLLGKRIAMAGSDWIRIVLTVGGAALALRVVAEVRHSKLALVMMLLAIGCFAVPIAARWDIMQVHTPLRWWLVTSAPLMAAATLAVACGAYLRKLFREVRRIDETDRLLLRFQQWRMRTFPPRRAEPATEQEAAAPKRAASKSKPGKPAAAAASSVAVSKAASKRAASEPAAEEDQAAVAANVVAGDAAAGDAADAATKPRWGWLRRFRRGSPAPADAAANDEATESQATEPPEDEESTAPPKSRFSKGPLAKAPFAKAPLAKARGAAAKTPVETASEPSADAPAEEAADVAKPRRSLGGMLGGWLKGKRSAATESTAESAEESAAEQSESADRQSAGANDGRSRPAASAGRSANRAAPSREDADDDREAALEDDGIDWESMGKAERRRLRRELKRNGEAA